MSFLGRKIPYKFSALMPFSLLKKLVNLCRINTIYVHCLCSKFILYLGWNVEQINKIVPVTLELLFNPKPNTYTQNKFDIRYCFFFLLTCHVRFSVFLERLDYYNNWENTGVLSLVSHKKSLHFYFMMLNISWLIVMVADFVKSHRTDKNK